MTEQLYKAKAEDGSGVEFVYARPSDPCRWTLKFGTSRCRQSLQGIPEDEEASARRDRCHLGSGGAGGGVGRGLCRLRRKLDAEFVGSLILTSSSALVSSLLRGR